MTASFGRSPVRVPDASPFSFAPIGDGSHDGIGVLVLHGFTGTPFEVRLLGENLAARGFAVEGPCLAGHCGTTRDLARSTWRDWVETADCALDRLRDRLRARAGARRVVVCGLSMGGLVTLELARRRPQDISAICALSTALFLSEAARRFTRVTSRVPLVSHAALPKLAGSDIADDEMRRLNNIAQGRAWMPLPALASLVEFGEHVSEHLSEIRTPALLAHSRKDHTVPFACLDAVARGISTPRRDVRTLILEQSHHVITLDVERERVFAAVADHVLEYTR